jgi:hypothetical protein
VWLAKLTERGMLRPSFVPPPEIRALRDLTRTRLQLVRDRTREWQRLEKLLEGAQLTELRERIAVSGGPALHRDLARDGLLGLGDLLIDPAQGPSGAVVAVLVIDDLIPPSRGGPGRPGLGEDVPVRDLLAGCPRRHCATA